MVPVVGSAARRRSLVAVAGIAVVLASGCGGNGGVTGAQSQREAEAAAREVLAAGRASSLVVALTDRERTVWVRGFGLADRAAGTAPTGDTLYGIGSGSKMFATTAVMQLVEQGLVDLDTPLVHYVPSFAMYSPESAQVTVRMLLDHSSGLPGADYRNLFSSVPATGYGEQVLRDVAHERLKAPPGSMSVYCNDGFTLVESLVKAVTGQAYPEYVEENVLAPLGMTRSRFGDAAIPEGLAARAYDPDGRPRTQEYTLAFGSGGLFSTGNEYAAFARAFLNGGMGDSARVLTHASVETMGTDWTLGTFRVVDEAATTYGLGWDSVREPGLAAVAVRAWQKGGDTTDYHSEILVAPDHGLAVVVLQATNQDSTLKTAERVLLRALAERGLVRFPSPLARQALPEAVPPAGFAARTTGTFAKYDSVMRLETDDGATFRLVPVVEPAPPQVTPLFDGLRYREDGWLTSDAVPLASFQVRNGGGRTYLVVRGAGGYGHYLDEYHFAQKVEGPGGVAPAWLARTADAWVPVNEDPASIAWTDGVLAFSLVPHGALPGYLAVTIGGAAPSLVDASPGGSTDARAPSVIVMPGGLGRDVNDLEAVDVDGEPGLRFSGWLLRNASTIPPLPRATTTPVTIGPDGHAVWRAVDPSGDGVAVRFTGATAWKTFDAGFTLVGHGAGDGTATLPASGGRRHVLIFGAPGDVVGVEVR
jgi:CubicO group peptidase (beta-lactamase class C family)